MGYILNPVWPTEQTSLEGKIVKKGDAPLEGPQWEKWTVPQFKGKPAVLVKKEVGADPIIRKPAKVEAPKPMPQPVPKVEVPKPAPAPKVEAPKVEAPKVETPKPQLAPAPKVEIPKVEVKKVEIPKKDVKAEIKKIAVPKIEVPKTEVPKVEEPKKEEVKKAPVPSNIPPKVQFIPKDERMLKIKGVGQVTLKRLDDAGYRSIESLIGTEPEKLGKDINRTVEKAKEIVDAATELLEQQKKE